MDFKPSDTLEKKKKKKFLNGKTQKKEELCRDSPNGKLKKENEEGLHCEKSKAESSKSKGFKFSTYQTQYDDVGGDFSVSEDVSDDLKSKKRKKKKKKEESGGEDSRTLDLRVDAEVLNKRKQKKHLSENAQYAVDSNKSVDSSVQTHSEENTKKMKHNKKKREYNCKNSTTTYKMHSSLENEGSFGGFEETVASVSQIGAHSGETTKKKKHKKKKNECEYFHTSVDLDVDEVADLKSEEMADLVIPQKKKKKHVDNEMENIGQIEAHCEETPKKQKHKSKEKQCESSRTPVDLDVDVVSRKKKNQIVTGEKSGSEIEAHIEDKENERTEVSKKHKKRKRLLENEEPESVTVDALIAPKKKKMKSENEVKERFSKNDLTDNDPEIEANYEKTRHENCKKVTKQRRKTNRKLDDVKKKAETKRGVFKLKDMFALHDSDSDEAEEVALLEAKALEIKEKNRLSCTEEKGFSELRITLPWPIPPLHMIETRITMRPNEAQKEKIQELGVTVKAATYYSKTEDEQITKNWKEFCRMHDVPEDSKPFHNMVNPDGQVVISVPERLNFARFLAHNLNDRLLCSVYKRFRRLFPPQQLKTGSRFASEEDDMIIKYIKKSSSRTPYADLGVLLGRDKLSIEKRARILGEEASFGNLDVKWDTERVQEFIKQAVEVTHVANMKGLKNREITSEEWRELEKRLNIPVRKLQKGWACRIFPTLFIKGQSSTMQVKKNLVKILRERGEDDLKTIDWTVIQKEMGLEGQGFTGRGLHELLQGMIYHSVPVGMRNDSKRCLEYLEEALKNGIIRGRRIKKMEVDT